MPKNNNSRRLARTTRQPKGDGQVGQYFEDAWSLAKRTAVGLNEIRKLINIEEKALDTVQGSQTFDTTGNVYSLSTVAQGLDYNTRVGDSIRMQNIEVRWRVYKNSAASQTIFRVIMFRDLDGYGTAPTTADVLQAVGAATAPTTPPDFLNRKRFAIVRDEFHTLNNTGDSTVTGTWIVPHNGHILYLGTTAAASSNGKGSLYLAVVSDEALNTPSVAFTSRIVYTDD
jgi:hypothetical protein